MSKILILGAGFAGLTAAETLSASARPEDEITLVSVAQTFTFFPAIVPMVFGDFEPGEISFDLRQKLAGTKIRFVQGEVLSIDPEEHTVRIYGDDIEGRLHFDHLLIALGRRLATEKAPGFFEYGHHLLGVRPAMKFKRAIEEFVSGHIVVGLCPDGNLPVPVCESALALGRKFEKQISEGSISITAVFPKTIESAFAGSDLFRNVGSELRELGVEVRSNFPIGRIEENKLISASKNEIEYDLLMLVPPFRGQSPLSNLKNATNSAGFADVNKSLQLDGYETIYAAGDIIALDGPKFGYMAMEQGKVAAANILAQVKGNAPQEIYTPTTAWVISSRNTDSVFFHYGVWDETLSGYNENSLIGMAAKMRERYGKLRDPLKERAKFIVREAADAGI